MRETLVDILNHVNIGNIDTVKIDGNRESKETLISAFDFETQAILINGRIKTYQPILDGTMIINKIPLLKGLLNYPTFKKDDSSIEIKKKKVADISIPEEIIFTDVEGQRATYRLVNPKTYNKKIPELKVSSKLSFKPCKTKIQEFSQMTSLYSSIEKNFMLRIINDQIRFLIGEEDSAMHNAFIIMDTNKNVDIDSSYLTWNINSVLSILRLVADEDITISISSNGIFNIQAENDNVVYDYYISPVK